MKTPQIDYSKANEIWGAFCKEKGKNENLDFTKWHDENTVQKSNKYWYWYELKEIQTIQLVLF